MLLRGIFVVYVIMTLIHFSMETECCKELQLKSQENSKANRTIGHLLGLYTKHTNDTFYTRNGDNNSYLTKSNTWQVTKDASGSVGSLVSFEKCNVSCPEDCTNNQNWKFWDTHERQYVKDETIALECNPVECILNNWQSWTCPPECHSNDGQQATRNRTVEKPAKYNGQCLPLIESEPCDKHCKVNSVDQNGVSKETVICIIAIVLATIVITALIVFWKCVTLKKKKKKLTMPSIISNETSGNTIPHFTMPILSHVANNIMKTMQAGIDEATVNYDWTITLEKRLGEGEFGIVFKATMKKDISTREVAIKQVKNIANQGQLDSLRTELEIMNLLKDQPHQNLVSLIDHLQIDGEAGCLVMEYCNLGQLKDYLRYNNTTLLLEADVGEINSMSLCVWAHHISKGMGYLQQRKIMHGDLAARNVLLSTDNNGHPIAKINDFGLAKNFWLAESVYTDCQEVSKNSKLPWKWMAYEVLAIDPNYTLKSDVWSFGVLLWELLSIGRMPYPEYLKLDGQFLEFLKDGHFLTFPDELENVETWSPKSLFDDVSRLCFQIDESKRGSFFDVTKIIESYLYESYIVVT